VQQASRKQEWVRNQTVTCPPQVSHLHLEFCSLVMQSLPVLSYLYVKRRLKAYTGIAGLTYFGASTEKVRLSEVLLSALHQGNCSTSEGYFSLSQRFLSLILLT